MEFLRQSPVSRTARPLRRRLWGEGSPASQLEANLQTDLNPAPQGQRLYRCWSGAEGEARLLAAADLPSAQHSEPFALETLPHPCTYPLVLVSSFPLPAWHHFPVPSPIPERCVGQSMNDRRGPGKGRVPWPRGRVGCAHQ